MNIVGRDLTTAPGVKVFNLHIGYYRDPATGRLCGIVDDSYTCVAPRCKFLGCFPTLREVLDAIVDFLKTALKVIGIILLLVIIALILRWLLSPVPVPAPATAPALAGAGGEGQPAGGTVEPAGGETEETPAAAVA
ncbi:MAG TPA: hypothetical protein VGX68_17965 [Thermoanaerobaculia bacterium]|jgi:hypothetical protein|nr:hypothetical protein [Thermoanaerobaculia bacterium]